MKAESQSISKSPRLNRPWLTLFQAWNIFRKRMITFCSISLIPFLALLFIALASSTLFSLTTNKLGLMAIVFLTALALLLTVFLFIWSQVSLVVAILNEGITIKEAYVKSKKMILEYIVLSLLSGKFTPEVQLMSN